MSGKINGYRVIDETGTPGGRGTLPGRVILVDRECEFDRYVTAWIANDAKSWCHGHYFQGRPEAEHDFVRRAERGY